MNYKLSKIDANPPIGADEASTRLATKQQIQRLGELQHLLYAEGKRSLLVVLQGMDASGKDGAIRNVFSKCNLSGTHVVSFGKPSDQERDHDFLWRVHRRVPGRGHVVIFNRSHYEDILVQRVHKTIDMKRVGQRMAAINAFEHLLAFDNDTLVLKFFLHISSDEQQNQLKKRLTDPKKFWKHNDADWIEREHWDDYMKCYEYVLGESKIPWMICPANNRWYRDYVISSAIVKALGKLRMRLPKPNKIPPEIARIIEKSNTRGKNMGKVSS
jgi:PPK2 family polyphosphate:nucleotide phosphotransferase